MPVKRKKNLNPATLAKRESKVSTPYKIISDFFSAAPLEHYRKFISSMLKTAYSEDYWKSSDPGSLLHFQDQMLELIKAAHLFLNTNKDSLKRTKKVIVDDSVFDHGLETSSYCGLYGEKVIWEFFPRSLTKSEFLNPFKTYKRFFEYKDIQTWLKEFKELIFFALEPFGNETAIDYDYLEIHVQLQKLVEASHLIEIRTNKSFQTFS